MTCNQTSERFEGKKIKSASHWGIHEQEDKMKYKAGDKVTILLNATYADVWNATTSPFEKQIIHHELAPVVDEVEEFIAKEKFHKTQEDYIRGFANAIEAKIMRKLKEAP